MGYAALTMRDFANQGKIKEIEKVLDVYRPLVLDICAAMMQEFFDTGKIKTFIDDERYGQFKSRLSTRYSQTAYAQGRGICLSYIESMKNLLAEKIKEADVSSNLRHQLFSINKAKAWFNNGYKSKKIEITDEARKYAQWLFHFHDKDSRFNCDNINMVLDANVALIKEKIEGKATKFDYWIRISTTVKGKPVYIPIETNPYFENYEGIRRDTVQVNKKDGILTFSFIKKFTDAEIRKGEKRLGIDIGLKTLFATSYGDLLGAKYVEKLDKMQARIDKLHNNLMAQGIAPRDNKRYRILIRKRKSFMKNEINRIINKLIRYYEPDIICVEKLDFRGARKLNKKTRVRSQNYGQVHIYNKLERVQQKQGIKIVKVNPAYTSQLCHKCGNVEKNNRKGQKYRCGCGYAGHADVNAARNISARSSWGEEMTKEEIRRNLVKQYQERQGLTGNPALQSADCELGSTNSSANRLSVSTRKRSSLGCSEGSASGNRKPNKKSSLQDLSKV